MKLKQYLLNEERLSGGDKKTLKGYIKNPKKASFLLSSFSKNYDESEREVDVEKLKDGVEFTYNMDHYELTNALVNMVDSMDEYQFSTSGEKQTNTMYFKVSKEK